MSKELIKDTVSRSQGERILMRDRAYEIMNQGVKIRDPYRFDLRGELICGVNVEIDINVIIEGKVVLGDNVKIESHCTLISSSIGNGSIIKSYSIVEKAEIGCKSFVGPYGRLRSGTKLGDGVQIGNFVEIKDSTIVCRCENITAEEIKKSSILTGDFEINRIKAFCRVGMGRCQGRICGVTTAEILSSLHGISLENVGYFRAQSPVRPIPTQNFCIYD